MCASPHVQKLSVAVRNYHQLDQAISQVNLITTTFIRKKKHFKLEVQPIKPSRPHCGLWIHRYEVWCILGMHSKSNMANTQRRPVFYG